MKSIIILFIFLSTLNAFGQNHIDPKVVVLCPFEVKIDNKVKKLTKAFEINCLSMRISTYAELLDSLNNSDLDTTIFSLHQKSIFEYGSRLTFENHMSLGIATVGQQYLFTELKNCVVILEKEKSDGQLYSLKSLSKKFESDYIINIPSIHYHKKNGQIQSITRLQLYDSSLDRIIIDKTGNNHGNLGSRTTCRIDNQNIEMVYDYTMVLSQILNNIKSKGETLNKGKQIEFIINNYYSDIPNQEIKNIIANTPNGARIKGYYQGIFNSQKDRFVAFSAEESFILPGMDKYDSVLILGTKKDGQWKISLGIEACKIPTEELDEEKKKEFSVRLQKLGFLKAVSLELNDDFWENNF